jgi:methylated-DNA-[protein]-cysteine S-methyltransferase
MISPRGRRLSQLATTCVLWHITVGEMQLPVSPCEMQNRRDHVTAMRRTQAIKHVGASTVMRVASPFGPLRLFATDDRLVGLYLADRPAPDGVAGENAMLASFASQLEAYFAGARRAFDVHLIDPDAPAPRSGAPAIALIGTPFQRAVWSALLAIPYGETRSYGELARQLGRPLASRAVGAANGANPISIIVPCHRLVGSDGSLTGYAGGRAMKRGLLALESARRDARRG